MSAPAGADRLTAADLARFCEHIYARTGMQFGEAKRYYVERRLRDRMAANDIASFASYFSFLRADLAEAEALINSFTVNETYFYREEHQLRCLVHDLLPEIVARKQPGDKVRIWSVPCSTGEESYSIALWLLENWRMVDAYNVEIVGSDIDTDALARARQGRYGARSLARLPAEVLGAYFGPEERNGREIVDDLKESVAYTHVNLIDRNSMAAHGRFDVIFCRNVLIYFDEASRLTAARNLYEALAPGGFVCLGHTESMSRILKRFRSRRFKDAIVHQRPED